MTSAQRVGGHLAKDIGTHTSKTILGDSLDITTTCRPLRTNRTSWTRTHLTKKLFRNHANQLDKCRKVGSLSTRSPHGGSYQMTKDIHRMDTIAVVRDSSLDEYTANAKGIAWDTCHKIYVLMDDEQMRLMESYGYDPLISSDEMTPHQMSETVADWYARSCGLRFISAVFTDEDDPNAGFHDIVAQFADESDEDEDEDY